MEIVGLEPRRNDLARGILIARSSRPLDATQQKALWDALPARSRGHYAETSAELVPELMRALKIGDVVLVKGSFGSRMSVVIEALRARNAAAA